MIIIYWIIGCVFVYYEIYYIFNFKMMRNLESIISDANDNNSFDKLDTHELGYIIFNLIYKIWCCAGFFTSQWFILLSIGFLFPIIKNKINKEWCYLADCIITICLLSFACINQFYFKINII